MADLASLMNVAPITGGMMIGQQANSELATAAATREELAQKIQELQLGIEHTLHTNAFLSFVHQQSR